MEKISLYTTDSINNDDPIEINNSEEQIIVPIDKLECLKKEIDDLISLEDNWDGYGGKSVFETIGNIAKQFISIINDCLIDNITDIYPNPHGTITIEWENIKQEKLSLEIGQTNYSYFIKYSGQNPKLKDGQNIISDIKDITSDLDSLFRDEVPTYVL